MRSAKAKGKRQKVRLKAKGKREKEEKAKTASQLVDAGSSIGANLEESASGRSKPDFIAKQCIALKESRRHDSGCG